jgi:secreted trypsin-like serine protease
MIAKQWVRHESFDPTNSQRPWDIGLVQLPADVYYSKNTAIATLYLKDPEIVTSAYYNQFATVVGWGQTSQTAALSPKLKYTSVRLIDNPTCRNNFSVLSKQICSVSANSTIAAGCVGDLGGPLILNSNGYVIGVFSNGAGGCEQTSPKVYTLIYPYYPWIVQKLRIANQGGTW